MQAKGQVWWLTTWLNFPHDRDEWVKQEPLTGDPRKWVRRNLHGKLSFIQLDELAALKKIGWKDNNGVWIHVQILPNKIPTKWGSKLPV